METSEHSGSPGRGWAEYYRRTDVRSFGQQIPAYRKAISYLRDVNPAFLTENQAQTIVLGGLHASNQTPEEFKAFHHEIHPNGADTELYVDLNRDPLKTLDPEVFPNRVRADIRNLPFNENVDLLFLDWTLSYLKKRQVMEFAESAAHALSPQGVVLAVVPDTLKIPFLSDFLLQRSHGSVPVYSHNADDIIRLSKNHLKPVYNLHASAWFSTPSTFSLVGFARGDTSNFPKFTGLPIAFEQETPPPSRKVA